MRLRARRQPSQFWPILSRFVNYYSPFWGPKAISIVIEPQGALHVGHQQSQYSPILARSVDYYSLFWGPRVISTIDDPRGAFTCPSSTLIVLANSDPFHGLLLTVLGSRSDFHSCYTPRCACVTVINTRRFGRFWPFSWTVTHCFGVPGDFHN